MGKIPEYQRKPVVQEPVDQTARAEAANIQAQGQVVNAVIGAAGTAHQMYVAREEIRAASWRNKRLVEAEQQTDEIWRSWQKESLDDPHGKTERLMARLDRMQDKLVKDAPNDLARKTFSEVMSKHRVQMKNKGQVFEDNQLLKNFEKTAVESLEYLATKVYRNPTPKNLATAAKEAETIVDPLNLTKNPQKVEELTRQYNQAAAASMFQGLLDGRHPPVNGKTLSELEQVNRAESLLKTKAFDEALGVDGIARIQKAIKSRKKFKRAKAKNYTELKFKNPYKFLMKINDNPPPIDLGKPGETIEGRLNWREAKNKQHGIDLPLLSPLEELAFKSQLKKLSPREQAEAMSGFRELPEDTFRELVGQLGEEDPTFTVAAAVASQGTKYDENLAVEILEGEKLLKPTKGGYGSTVFRPKKSELTTIFNNAVKNGVRSARGREEIMNGATAIWAKRRMEQGIADDEFTEKDQDIFEQAITDMLGEPYETNNSVIFPYKEKGRFVPAETIEEAIGKISNENLEATHKSALYNAKGNIFDTEAGKERFEYRRTKDKRTEKIGYLIIFEGTPLQDKDGNLFILDVKKLNKAPAPQSATGKVWESFKEAAKAGVEWIGDVAPSMGTTGKQ